MKKILLAFLFLSILSCKPEEIIDMRYIVTQCADPWGFTNGNLEGTVKDFLDDNDLDYQEITFFIEDDLILTCNACECTTGDVILLKTEEMNLEEFLNLGFEEI